MASRGCPFNCKFCGSKKIWGRTVRFRRPDHVADEVEWLHDRFHVDEIYYVDDTLNVDRRWIEALCREQIRRGLSDEVYFKGQVRVNREMIDLPLLRLMRKAGFWLLVFGGESGVQRILDSIDKRVTLEELERGAKLIRRAGMRVAASFIIGHVEDDESTIRETIRFAERLKLDWFDFPISTPLPGSALEEECERLGLIRTRDWGVYAMGRAVADTKHLRAEELEEWRERAFNALYRKKVVRRMLRNPIFALEVLLNRGHPARRFLQISFFT
jgi:radical SAM superfamily enzyme YgiQ (UPF0313 family)